MDDEVRFPTAIDIAENSVKVSLGTAQQWIDENRIEVHEDGSVHLDAVGRLYPWSYTEEGLWPDNVGPKPDQSELTRHGTSSERRAGMRAKRKPCPKCGSLAVHFSGCPKGSGPV